MNAAQPISSSRKLVSLLLEDDTDLRDIVEQFVHGLSHRLAELRQAYEALDWEQLTMLAHRLKGASGSYGYPDLSELAATMEHAFRNQQADGFAQWMEQFRELTGAARNGLERT